METKPKLKMKVPMLDLQKKYDGRAFNMQINNTGDQPVRVRLFGNGQTFAEVVDQEEAKVVAPLKMFSSLDEIIAFADPVDHSASFFSFMWLGPDTTIKPNPMFGSAIELLKKGVVYNIKQFSYDPNYNQYVINGYESINSFRKISQGELKSTRQVTDTPILFESAINKDFIFISDGSFSRGSLPLVNADSFVNNAVYWYGKTNPFTNETTESPCIYFLCDFTKIPTQADLNPVVDVTYDEFYKMRNEGNLDFGKYYHITDFTGFVNNPTKIRQLRGELADLIINKNCEGYVSFLMAGGFVSKDVFKVKYDPEINGDVCLPCELSIANVTEHNTAYSLANKAYKDGTYYFCFNETFPMSRNFYWIPADFVNGQENTYYFLNKSIFYTNPVSILDAEERIGVVNVTNPESLSYKGYICRMTDIYGNSFPFDFYTLNVSPDGVNFYIPTGLPVSYGPNGVNIENIVYKGDKIDFNFHLYNQTGLTSARYRNIEIGKKCENVTLPQDENLQNIFIEDGVKNITLETSVLQGSDDFCQNIRVTAGDYKDSQDQPQTVTIDRNRNYVTTVGLTSLGQVQAKNLMD